ncbi:MAG TPA: M56 family metallopeptidase [Sphingomicrobium sp.]|nr:M56 family metallopeptidase [Sphingomicrobium sp.]
MSILIAIALKSLFVAGLTLGLLALMKQRSAAERSWVAHIGLLALMIMAFAPLALPAWNVEVPALFSPAPPVEAPAQASASILKASSSEAPAMTALGSSPQSSRPSISAAAAASAIYAVPAAILLLITLLALVRLFALRARADVLVDGHWLSALARAQRRMGFKHGTALLTSNELASPISWGLMRPVIVLNMRAVEASNEAEAIIAHELAHVARMDWMKLLLARLATALFWFNPLVWQLAREAHQLREEAADDAVLAADIADTDYAQLLVGVARHECPGFLLGAHGVAPSKTSLARRVARVLDGKSVRGPVARSFALGVFVGAVMVAAPLAALTFTPAGSGAKSEGRSSVPGASEPAMASSQGAREVPADLPHLIASGVSTSVATAAAAISPNVARGSDDLEVTSPSGSKVISSKGMMVATSPNGTSATIYPPDAAGRRKMVAVAANGATAVTYLGADRLPQALAARAGRSHGDDAVDTAIELKALGVTPDYIAAMRGASPALRNASLDDIIEMKSVGASPDYVQQLTSAGFGNLDADAIKEIRAVGVTPDYLRRIRASGIRVSVDDIVELRAMNIAPEEVARLKGTGAIGKQQILDLAGPRPPHPPAPPALPQPPGG